MNQQKIIITDVGPRDGLQNQPKMLSVSERLSLIKSIAAAGVGAIEVGSFVSPKAVPAMIGTNEIVGDLRGNTDAEYSALIPNLKGYELAVAAGAKTVAMVLYASEGMALKNVNMSIAEAEEATIQIIERARSEGIKVIATIAVAFSCPFDGATDPALVSDITRRFLDLGVDQIVIADTIGAATPAQVSALATGLVTELGAERLGFHFHDTRAMGLANVYAVVSAGIRRFDASIAGLGGCPFAPGASGNVATEDVVMMLEQMGYSTGVDMLKLLEASDLAEQLTGTAPGGRAKKWLQRYTEKRQDAA